MRLQAHAPMPIIFMWVLRIWTHVSMLIQAFLPTKPSPVPWFLKRVMAHSSLTMAKRTWYYPLKILPWPHFLTNLLCSRHQSGCCPKTVNVSPTQGICTSFYLFFRDLNAPFLQTIQSQRHLSKLSKTAAPTALPYSLHSTYHFLNITS